MPSLLKGKILAGGPCILDDGFRTSSFVLFSFGVLCLCCAVLCCAVLLGSASLWSHLAAMFVCLRFLLKHGSFFAFFILYLHVPSSCFFYFLSDIFLSFYSASCGLFHLALHYVAFHCFVFRYVFAVLRCAVLCCVVLCCAALCCSISFAHLRPIGVPSLLIINVALTLCYHVRVVIGAAHAIFCWLHAVSWVVLGRVRHVICCNAEFHPYCIYLIRSTCFCVVPIF